jgi:hypothetical protein
MPYTNLIFMLSSPKIKKIYVGSTYSTLDEKLDKMIKKCSNHKGKTLPYYEFINSSEPYIFESIGQIKQDKKQKRKISKLISIKETIL